MIEVSAVRRSNLPRDDDIEASSSPTLDQRIVSWVLPALHRQNRCFGIAVTIVLLVAAVYVVAVTYSEPDEYAIAEAFSSQTGSVTDQADNAKVQEALEKHKSAHAHGSFDNPFNGLRGSPFGNHDGNPDDPWSRTNADLDRGDPAWVLERRNQTAIKIAAQELRWNQTHPGVPFPYGYDQGAFNLSSFLTNHPSLVGRLNRTKHGFVEGGSNTIGSQHSTPVDPPTEAPVTPPTTGPEVLSTNSPMESFPSLVEATPGPVEAMPIPVEATPVPETPIPVEATLVPETPIPVEATPVPETPIPVEATLVPETPIPVEATPIPETPIPVEATLVPETPIPVEATPIPETPIPVEATLVPETPIPVETIPDPVEATSLPAETQVPVDYSTWHTATVKLADGIKYEVIEIIPHDGSSFTYV